MSNFTTWRSLVDGEEISAIPDSVIDNFEEDPDGPYNGDNLTDFYSDGAFGGKESFEITTSNPIEGNRSLFQDETSTSQEIISLPDDGLPNYFEKGQTAAFLVQGSGADGRFCFGAPNTNDYYFAGISIRDNIIELNGRNDGSVLSASTSVSLASNEAYQGRVAWHDGTGERSEDVIVFDVFEWDGERGEKLAEVEDVDATLSGSGVGWATSMNSADDNIRLDDARKGDFLP